MERRFAIKQILILAGGIVLLPSCLKQQGKASILLSNINVDLEDEQLLSEVAETMIPKTTTPGAKDLKLHLFALKMVDDCEEKEDQVKFLKGLSKFKDVVKQKYSVAFASLSPVQRKAALLDVQNASDENLPELKVFYKVMKGRTIEGYLNSQYVMRNLNVWELVPGRYNGYFPVRTA